MLCDPLEVIACYAVLSVVCRLPILLDHDSCAACSECEGQSFVGKALNSSEAANVLDQLYSTADVVALRARARRMKTVQELQLVCQLSLH